MTIVREHLAVLVARLSERRRFIHVLSGPRQVGKTTLARQAVATLGQPTHATSADGPVAKDPVWISQQWDLARLLARESQRGALLVLDEVQKVPGWSDAVKVEWDADTATGDDVRVLLLGSAPVMLGHGLAESLAGRFEVLHLPHWSWPETRAAFGWDIDQYVYFGGYPGAAPLVDDEERWAAYVRDAIVEPAISRDVLSMVRVDKPALLRRTFDLACEYSGQVLSYTKMLGQLIDAGNTTTIAHYLELLAGAGLVCGLQKHATAGVRRRGSSPKLCVLNTALVSSRAGRTLHEVRRDGESWGRLVESAVGAHLVNTAIGTAIEVGWWRDGNDEVDYVLRRGKRLAAVEVKSGRHRGAHPGLAAFDASFKPARKWLVGSGGMPLGDFLSRPAGAYLD